MGNQGGDEIVARLERLFCATSVVTYRLLGGGGGGTQPKPRSSSNRLGCLLQQSWPYRAGASVREPPHQKPVVPSDDSVLRTEDVKQNHLTQACYDGLKCEWPECPRMHGEHEPRQELEFKRHAERCKKELWGHAVCWHFLKRKKCKLGHHCQYRHLINMRPLSAEQRAAIARMSLSSRSE